MGRWLVGDLAASSGEEGEEGQAQACALLFPSLKCAIL